VSPTLIRPGLLALVVVPGPDPSPPSVSDCNALAASSRSPHRRPPLLGRSSRICGRKFPDPSPPLTIILDAESPCPNFILSPLWPIIAEAGLRTYWAKTLSALSFVPPEDNGTPLNSRKIEFEQSDPPSRLLLIYFVSTLMCVISRLQARFPPALDIQEFNVSLPFYHPPFASHSSTGGTNHELCEYSRYEFSFVPADPGFDLRRNPSPP